MNCKACFSRITALPCAWLAAKCPRHCFAHTTPIPHIALNGIFVGSLGNASTIIRMNLRKKNNCCEIRNCKNDHDNCFDANKSCIVLTPQHHSPAPQSEPLTQTDLQFSLASNSDVPQRDWSSRTSSADLVVVDEVVATVAPVTIVEVVVVVVVGAGGVGEGGVGLPPLQLDEIFTSAQFQN